MQTHWSDGVVLIRPYQPGDAEVLFEAARESIPEVGQWLAWCHPAYSREEARTWIAARPLAWETGEAYSFGIFDGQSGQYLGGCGLNALRTLHNFANALRPTPRVFSTPRGSASGGVCEGLFL